MASNIDAYFFQLTTSLKMSALKNLGKIESEDGEDKINIEQARISIEMLAMLSEKTFDNATEDEKTMLDEILFDLRRLLSDVISETEANNN